MSKNFQELWDSFMQDTTYDKLTDDEKVNITFKVDNFLEALYLNPLLFAPEVISILKKREEKLKLWRRSGELVLGGIFMAYYLRRNLKYSSGFYFRNFWTLVIFTGLFAFVGGRSSELIGNKLYYQKIIYKMANQYDITDEEIEELQVKVNQQFLTQQTQDQSKKSSLDSIKFKF